jgi:2-keto-4-pentenoate hydratase/2-oxohepta-3-ene-1,7-dioic acid hydratase in catechol pathway
MRFCRFDDDRYGVVAGDKVHDITEAVNKVLAGKKAPRNGDPMLTHFAEVRAAVGDGKSFPAKALSSVTLLSPTARPSKLIAAPTNYHAHVAEMRARRPNDPPGKGIKESGLFLKANSAMVGAGEGVHVRFLDRLTEHELEFMIVIGKEGSQIPEDKALDYVAGYCLSLDMTVRGGEERSIRKSIDSYAVIGPWMVTKDEIANPNDIPFKLFVNGQVRHNAHTNDLIFNCQKLIALASEFYTLYPGDVIFTGAPAGVGPVKPGDVMTAECAAIGPMEVKVYAYKNPAS